MCFIYFRFGFFLDLDEHNISSLDRGKSFAYACEIRAFCHKFNGTRVSDSFECKTIEMGGRKTEIDNGKPMASYMVLGNAHNFAHCEMVNRKE